MITVYTIPQCYLSVGLGEKRERAVVESCSVL